MLHKLRHRIGLIPAPVIFWSILVSTSLVLGLLSRSFAPTSLVPAPLLAVPIRIYYAEVASPHSSVLLYGSKEWDINGPQLTVGFDFAHLHPVYSTASEDLVTDAGTRLTSNIWKPIVVVIHGFNMTKQDALAQARLIAGDWPSDLSPFVAFIWPSAGSMDAYDRDEETIQDVDRPLGLVVDSVAQANPGRPIVLIAHSMGNRALLAYLRARLKQRDTSTSPVPSLESTIMIAPDIDARAFSEAFREKDGALARSVGKIFLLASSADKALLISAMLHGGHRRAGQGGPEVRGLPNIEVGWYLLDSG